MPTLTDRPATLINELPAEVRQQLGRIRSRIALQAIALGMIRVTLALATAVVISFALDSLLELPLGLRMVVSGAAAALLVVAFFRFVVFSARRDTADDEIALKVEREFPELEDRLISAVQLERELAGPDAGWNSRDLIRAVIGETAGRLRSLDLGKVARRPKLPRVTFLTVIVACALGGFFYTEPGLAQIWFERNVLMKETPWPSEVDFVVDHDDTPVILGDSFTATVRVTRGATRRMTIDSYFPGRIDRDRDMVQQGDTYRWTYPNVTDGFEYQVRAAGASSTLNKQRYAVTVVVPPRVEEIGFYLEFPDYTNRPPTPIDDPVRHTTLRVPAGTKIKYRASANMALQDVRLVELTDLARGIPAAQRGENEAEAIAKSFEGEAVPPAGATAPEIVEDGRTITGELLAVMPTAAGPKPGEEGDGDKPAAAVDAARATPSRRVRRLALALRSEDGIVTRRPTVFEVRVDPDRPPTIDVTEPGRTKDVTPAARVQITARATDDYGIVAADLVYRIRAGADGAESEEVSVELQELVGEGERETMRTLEPGAREMRLRTAIDVGGIGAKPGDRVIYTARARDQYPGDRAEAPARSYELRVVSAEELLRILQERLLRLRAELRQIEKLQERARDLGAEVAQSGAAKPALSRPERKKLYESEIIERKVATRLGLVAKELERIADERRQNKVGDDQEIAWHEDLRAIAAGLAERDVPEVARVLEVLRKADEHDVLKLRETAASQDAILDAIRSLAARINRWGDYTEVIRELRNLMGEQESIFKKTQDAVRDKHK